MKFGSWTEGPFEGLRLRVVNSFNWALHSHRDRKGDPRKGISPLKGFVMPKMRELFMWRYNGAFSFADSLSPLQEKKHIDDQFFATVGGL